MLRKSSRKVISMIWSLPLCLPTRSGLRIFKTQKMASANRNWCKFHSLSLPSPLILQKWRDSSHWCKLSKQRKGTCWMLSRSDGFYSYSTVSEELFVFIATSAWRQTYNYLTESHLQRCMNGHIRKNVARRLAGVVSNKEDKDCSHNQLWSMIFILFIYLSFYFFLLTNLFKNTMRCVTLK